MVRIKKGSIHWRDQYYVVRTGNVIHIKFAASSGTTFPWPEPEKDGYIVQGYPSYSGEAIGQEKINILGMVISAIDQAKGIEPDPFRFVGTMKEQEATMREYIGGNLCYIPEYSKKA